MKHQPTIIGLAGFAQTGKDTVASILVEEQGYTRFAFADTLRAVLYDTNPMVQVRGGWLRLQQLVDGVGWDMAKQYAEVRRLLQDLGKGVREHCGADVWRDAILDKLDGCDKVVITDVRFPNEADAITDLRGDVWVVRRPGVGPVNSHVSEVALAGYDFDYYIDNDGDLRELATEVYAALDQRNLLSQ